jgi:multidrug resistance efflux pump
LGFTSSLAKRRPSLLIARVLKGIGLRLQRLDELGRAISASRRERARLATSLSNAILQQSISRGADDSYALTERQEDQAYKMRQMEDKMRQMQYDLDMARIEANDHD